MLAAEGLAEGGHFGIRMGVRLLRNTPEEIRGAILEKVEVVDVKRIN